MCIRFEKKEYFIVKINLLPLYLHGKFAVFVGDGLSFSGFLSGYVKKVNKH